MLSWDENRDYGAKYMGGAYAVAMRDMVKRDRSHPSVAVWSFCNEYECGQFDAAYSADAFRAATLSVDTSRAITANHYGDASLSSHLDVRSPPHRPFHNTAPPIIPQYPWSRAIPSIPPLATCLPPHRPWPRAPTLTTPPSVPRVRSKASLTSATRRLRPFTRRALTSRPSSPSAARASSTATSASAGRAACRGASPRRTRPRCCRTWRAAWVCGL